MVGRQKNKVTSSSDSDCIEIPSQSKGNVETSLKLLSAFFNTHLFGIARRKEA